ncbi:MAG: ATP-binding protein [Pseudonocardia sp.]|nr:ATP-binding protein [Pseudonocardia sp.]
MERVGSPDPGSDSPAHDTSRRGVALDRHITGPEALTELRRWIRTHVAAGPDTVDDAQLVCTELASNALEHAPGPRVVRITLTEAEFTVEVDDGAPDAPLTLGTSRLGSIRGRGLLVVNALGRWGVRRYPAGKTVWATIPLPP